MKLLVIASLTLLSLGGCAIGRRHAYHVGQPRLNHRGPGWIAVGVQDRRGDVVNGNEEETFVGISRGGFGNPFDVTTASGRALATDFADTICHALIANQYRVNYVQISPRQSPQQVVSALATTGAPRLLLVEIKKWKSDTYNNTDLDYHVTAHVLDNQGQQLAVSDIDGDDSLGGSFMDPPGYAEEAIPPAYLERIQRLLNQPSIGPALRALPPPAPPAPVPPASVSAPPSS